MPLTEYMPAYTDDGGVSSLTLAMNPVGYWRLSDTGYGAAVDLSPNGYDGTIVGTPGITNPGPIALDTGHASSFALGNPDYVQVTTMGTFGASLATCSASLWMRTSVTATQMHFFGAQNTGNSLLWRALLNSNQNGVTEQGKIEVLLRDNNGLRLRAATTSDTGITDGNWHHVAIVCSGAADTVTYYIDGSSVATSYNFQETPAVFGNLDRTMELARLASGTKPYTGDLAEVAMFASALTATDAALLAAQGIN